MPGARRRSPTLDGGRELVFTVGGEGYAWVEVYDDNLVVFDSMGFDDMNWALVERAMGLKA